MKDTKTSIVRDIKQAFLCRCPRCGQGRIYKNFLTLVEKCDHCALPIADNDSGDGPAVFIIFILGFLLVPLALIVDHLWHPHILVHMLLWTALGIALVIGLLRPIKAYVMILLYRHRPDMWDKPKK